jgi:pimeloyl-ACP methyl ester carboxylesterase
VIAHEPPLFGVGERNRELRPAMWEVRAQLDDIADLLRHGNPSLGAEKFIEEVALGPDAWVHLPEEIRQTMVDNAPTFLETISDPDWAELDVEALNQAHCPVLLTDCEQGPPYYSAVIAELASQLERVWRYTFAGAGHMPHLSQPAEYVETVRSFAAATA